MDLGNVKVNSENIDVAIEKATKLKNLLTEVNELIVSLGKPVINNISFNGFNHEG